MYKLQSYFFKNRKLAQLRIFEWPEGGGDGRKQKCEPDVQ